LNNNQLLDPKLQKGGLFGGPQQYFQKSQGVLHEFYLCGEILEPTEYCEWFDIIRNANPQDNIRIYINSGGGDLYTAMQFLRVFGETQAHVTCSIEGACMSAATMIFLHAHSFEVTPHSCIMIHNYSGGMYGKGGELYDQLQFERSWSEKFMQEVYKDFLTSEEITSILQNKDIWMTSDEVIARLEAMTKLRKKQDSEISIGE
jgi:ATP-dependent protease ClpP protease subunit